MKTLRCGVAVRGYPGLLLPPSARAVQYQKEGRVWKGSVGNPLEMNVLNDLASHLMMFMCNGFVALYCAVVAFDGNVLS